MISLPKGYQVTRLEISRDELARRIGVETRVLLTRGLPRDRIVWEALEGDHARRVIAYACHPETYRHAINQALCWWGRGRDGLPGAEVHDLRERDAVIALPIMDAHGVFEWRIRL